MQKINKPVIGILPLGGTASRMMGIPKFLLPCGINMTLLNHTIDKFLKNGISRIEAGVSQDNGYLLRDSKDMNKITISTRTMAETVHEIEKSIIEDDFKSILMMPDTYFEIQDELKQMIDKLDNYDIVAILWKIRDDQRGKMGQCLVRNEEIIDTSDKDPDCNFDYFWGCLGWNSSINSSINPKWETIGCLIKEEIKKGTKVGAIISNSNIYYDCGTFNEYFQMIRTIN